MANVLANMNYVQQQGELGRQQGVNRLTSRLAPDVMRGDPAAFRTVAQANPEAAAQYQDLGDRQYRRLDNVTKLMRQAIDTGNPQAKAQAFRTIRPFLSELTGKPLETQEWTDDMIPVFGQFEQRVKMAQAGGSDALPTGFRQFQMTAEAAGLKPGTPEYQQAANIALGREGRAATGGFSFEMVEGPDGRKRPARRNPRTGDFEVFSEQVGDFVPLGSAGQLGGQMGGAMPQGQGQQVVDQTVALANQMAQAGIDPAQIDQFVQSRLNAGGVSAGAPQPMGSPITGPRLDPVRGGYSGLGVGRSPEEQAAATEAAKTQTQLAYAPQVSAADASREAQMTAARERAQAEVAQQFGTADSRKAAREASAKLPQLNNAIRGLDRIDQALRGLEGGVIDTGPVDQFAQRYTKAGQELEGAVGAIQNSVLALTRVPGVGSQSDLEARQAALQYPSLDKNPETNRRTMENLRLFMEDLRNAYQNVTSGQDSVSPQAEPAQGAPRRLRFNPATGRIE